MQDAARAAGRRRVTRCLVELAGLCSRAEEAAYRRHMRPHAAQSDSDLLRSASVKHRTRFRKRTTCERSRRAKGVKERETNLRVKLISFLVVHAENLNHAITRFLSGLNKPWSGRCFRNRSPVKCLDTHTIWLLYPLLRLQWDCTLRSRCDWDGF